MVVAHPHGIWFASIHTCVGAGSFVGWWRSKVWNIVWHHFSVALWSYGAGGRKSVTLFDPIGCTSVVHAKKSHPFVSRLF